MEPTNEQLLERIQTSPATRNPFRPRGFSDALAQCLSDAAAAGLPPIQISPNEGKLLYSVAKLARAARVVEIGTLGGYSAIWLARVARPREPVDA
jgi:predicted O-methyltransferase YrrM